MNRRAYVNPDAGRAQQRRYHRHELRIRDRAQKRDLLRDLDRRQRKHRARDVLDALEGSR